MQKEKLVELRQSLSDVSSDLLQTISLFDQKDINTVLFEGSWTAAQVGDHLTLSNRGMLKFLKEPAAPLNREPDQAIEGLRDVFLNFTTKLKSPEFIIPRKQEYDRDELIQGLAGTWGKILQIANESELSVGLNVPIFGEMTRFELLSFVLFHTQRHTRQLENIRASLK